MHARDLLAFVERDWQAVSGADDEHWRRRKRELGAVEGLRAAAALLELVRALRPDWPSDEERASDLAHHVSLGESLRRARSARTA